VWGGEGGGGGGAARKPSMSSLTLYDTAKPAAEASKAQLGANGRNH
jgi:hypothetical protein